VLADKTRSERDGGRANSGGGETRGVAGWGPRRQKVGSPVPLGINPPVPPAKQSKKETL